MGAGLEQAADRELEASRAVEWLRAFAEAWQVADVPEAKAELIHAVYERVVVAGRRFVEVRLTPAAYRHGLALALPDAVMARPEGVARARATTRPARCLGLAEPRTRRAQATVTTTLPRLWSASTYRWASAIHSSG